MKSLVLLLALSLGGCGLLSGITTAREPAPPVEDQVDVVAQIVGATVALTTEDGKVFCSGVAAEGVFMTAHHCIDDGVPFRVLYNGKDYEGRVTLVWADQDLAFIDAIGARVDHFVKMTEWDVTVGQKVVWTGYPLGVEMYMGTGIVAKPASEAFYAEDFISIYGQFIPGNSGGPVFDEVGNLLGLVSSTMVFRGQLVPIGYAIPPQHIKKALESL